jgi:putative transcriptional regulator
MASARDIGLSSRLLLLLELHTRRHNRLKPMADHLGVTVQAVSDSLKRLAEEGLVHREDHTWRPTPHGVQRLHESFNDLRRFLDQAVRELTLIDDCVALAAGPIRTGERLGLFMHKGHLWARPRQESPSRGTAATSAATGGLVRVKDLEGIVALEPGTVTLLRHPSLPTAAQRRALGRAAPREAALAVHDTASHAVAATMKRPIAIEFAPIEATIDAARRGQDVAYLVPESQATHVAARLEEAKDASGKPLRIRIGTG